MLLRAFHSYRETRISLLPSSIAYAHMIGTPSISHFLARGLFSQHNTQSNQLSTPLVELDSEIEYDIVQILDSRLDCRKRPSLMYYV